jgi:subtilisin-like proprotein convertase family protein
MNARRSTRVLRALQTCSVAIAVVVACTVADKDDYTFTDEPSDSGAGGEATGGSAGKGGTSGSAGKGGTSGSAGKGGSSGNAGRGGSSGTGPGGEGGEGGEDSPGGSGGSAGEPPTGECGDGTRDPGEDCDDGNRVDEDCDYFATSCSGCGRTCRRLRPPSCGDGVTNGARATSMTLEYAATTCVAYPQPVPLVLNGVPIPNLPWGAPCSCGPGATTAEVTDSRVLSALRQDGNYLSFVTPATNEYIAWAVMTVVFSDGSRVSKVAFDWGDPGDAENRTPGDPGCSDPYTFLATGFNSGTAFGGFPVEQCDGGTDCVACASPQCVTLTSADTFAIPDFDSTTMAPGQQTSTLLVPALGSVHDADVTVNINHTFDGDLGLSLESPTSRATLASRRGADGDNYVGTQFDQACTTPIASGVAPFTGCFRPDESLDVFLGQPSGGRWSLRVTDNAVTDTGALAGWTLRVCGVP